MKLLEIGNFNGLTGAILSGTQDEIKALSSLLYREVRVVPAIGRADVPCGGAQMVPFADVEGFDEMPAVSPVDCGACPFLRGT